jgi:hypothetical protein
LVKVKKKEGGSMFFPGTPLYPYRGFPVVPPPPPFNRGKSPEDTFKELKEKIRRIIKKLRNFFIGKDRS